MTFFRQPAFLGGIHTNAMASLEQNTHSTATLPTSRRRFLQDEFDDDTTETLLDPNSRRSHNDFRIPAPRFALEMDVFERFRMTFLTYSIFMSSIILLAVAIAAIVVEEKVLHVFRDIAIQYPGSSLGEWMFVSLDPKNIDHGPTIAIFIGAGCAVVASLMSCIWMVTTWCDVKEMTIRRLSIASCVVAIINTATSLAVMAYVFVVESQMHLPEFFSQWDGESFTREYYICNAFPSVVHDADHYYGFEACDSAQAARFSLVGIAILSVLLAGLGVIEAYNCGAWRLLVKSSQDVEKGLASKERVRKMRSFGPGHRQISSTDMSHIRNVSENSVESIQFARPPAAMQRGHNGSVGYSST